MTWETYGSYLLLVVLVVIAPGPDTMIVLKNSLSGGARRGLQASGGIAVGNLLQGTAAALGLGALIVQSQPVFTTLRWLGVAYLCYLGIGALWAAYRGKYRTSGVEPSTRSTASRAWREGFLSNVTNPKVMVLYLSVLPQFLDPVHGSVGDALLLAYPVGVFGFLWLALVLFFVHRVRVWLQRRSVRRALDAVTGTALVGFGVALATEG